MNEQPDDPKPFVSVLRGRLRSPSGVLDPDLRIRPQRLDGSWGETVPIDSRGAFALDGDGVERIEVLDSSDNVLAEQLIGRRGQSLNIQIGETGLGTTRARGGGIVDPDGPQAPRPDPRAVDVLRTSLKQHFGDPSAAVEVRLGLEQFLRAADPAPDGVVAGFVAALWLEGLSREDLSVAELVSGFRDLLPGMSGTPPRRFGPGGTGPLLGAIEECAREAVRTLPEAESRNVGLGGAQPSVTCGGREAEVTLTPEVPGGLGDRSLDVVLTSQGSNDLSLQVISWSRDEVRVRIPAEAHSGVIWIRPLRGGLSRDCLALLGRIGGAPHEHWLEIANRNAGISRGVFVELVRPPVVEYLALEGRHPVASIEACKRATAAWDVGFGNPATRDADDISLHRIRVDLTVGGRMVALGKPGRERPATSLPPTGSEEIAGIGSRPFVLIATATSRLPDGATCGADKGRVFAYPYQRLRLSAPGAVAQSGVPLAVTVRMSCPSPQDRAVNLTYDGPLVGPAQVAVLGSSREVTFDVVGQGGCSPGRIFATSDDHSSADLSLMVVRRPEILAIDPVGRAEFIACEPTALRLEVDCLDPTTTEVQVKQPDGTVLDVAIESIQGTTLTTTPFDAARRGSHEVTVTSWGLTSVAALLVVKPPVATIVSFDVANLAVLLDDTAVPCTPSDARIEWEVRGARRVTIENTGSRAVIVDHLVTTDCGEDAGSRTVAIEGPTEWEICVVPVAFGPPLKSSAALGAAEDASILRKVVIFFEEFDEATDDPNRVPEVYRIWRWRHGDPIGDAEDLDDHTQGDPPVTVTLPGTCDLYDVVVVGESTLDAYNGSSVFGPFGFSDPEVLQHPGAHDVSWLDVKGHPDGMTREYTLPAYPAP